jgi:hypothetical protein
VGSGGRGRPWILVGSGGGWSWASCAWRWALARVARDGEDRVVNLDRAKFRRLVCDGERFPTLSGYFGASGEHGTLEEEDVPEGESGGVGAGLRRSSGIDSVELAAVEPPRTELGVVALGEAGLNDGRMTPFRELGVGGKFRESGESSSPGCRGAKHVCMCGRARF